MFSEISSWIPSLLLNFSLDGLDRIFQTFFNKLALDPAHFNNINGLEKSCFRLD